MASMRELSEQILGQTILNKETKDYMMTPRGPVRRPEEAVQVEESIFTKPLDMEGRFSMLPLRDMPDGTREYALPLPMAEMMNAFTAPGRSFMQPDFDAEKEALDTALAFTGGSSVGTAPVGSLAMGAPRRPRGIETTAEKPKIFTFPEYDSRFSARLKKTPEGKIATPAEAKRVSDLKVELEKPSDLKINDVSLGDYEGRAIITTMSDRSAVGPPIVAINGVKLFRPVELQGGQDYMFNGDVWSSADGPIKQIAKMAEQAKQKTGKNPLLAPWRMAPTGGDHAAMTGEVMLSYNAANMAKKDIKEADKAIKEIIPGWKGMQFDESVNQFRGVSGKKRKAVQNMLDKKFRDKGGLSLTEARLAVTDQYQLTAKDAGLQNLGEIYAGRPIVSESGHYTYPRSVEGEGLGRIVGAEDLTIFDIMSDAALERNIPTRRVQSAPGSNTGPRVLADPRATDIRAFQMKPYMGFLDDAVLRRLGQ